MKKRNILPVCISTPLWALLYYMIHYFQDGTEELKEKEWQNCFVIRESFIPPSQTQNVYTYLDMSNIEKLYPKSTTASNVKRVSYLKYFPGGKIGSTVVVYKIYIYIFYLT